MLHLEDRVRELEGRVRDLERALTEERLQRPERRVFAAGSAGGEVVTLKRGTRLRRNAEVVVWQP